MYPSYQQGTAQVTVSDSNLVRNFDLAVETSCVATGYKTGYGEPVVTEQFESGDTPAGWSVVNTTPNGGWDFTDPKNRGNLTGGSGKYAIADSDNAGSGKPMDTALITPAMDLSAVPAPVLRFNSDYRALGGFADVDVSVDDGTTWKNVTRWTSTSRRGPVLEEIPVPQAAGKSDVRIRFHYQATYAWWWELDNVSILNRTCDPIPGGLVVGRVLDGNTGAGLNDATVTSEDKPAEKAVTGPTPDDAKLGDGFYWMFSTLTGNHPFTGAKKQYKSITSTVDVAADRATREDFALKAGRLTITPPSVESSLTLGQAKTATTTIRNDGTAPATFELNERAGNFDILGTRGARLQNIRVKGAAYRPPGGATASPVTSWSRPRTRRRGSTRPTTRSRSWTTPWPRTTERCTRLAEPTAPPTSPTATCTTRRRTPGRRSPTCRRPWRSRQRRSSTASSTSSVAGTRRATRRQRSTPTTPVPTRGRPGPAPTRPRGPRPASGWSTARSTWSAAAWTEAATSPM